MKSACEEWVWSHILILICCFLGGKIISRPQFRKIYRTVWSFLRETLRFFLGSNWFYSGWKLWNLSNVLNLSGWEIVIFSRIESFFSREEICSVFLGHYFSSSAVFQDFFRAVSGEKLEIFSGGFFFFGEKINSGLGWRTVIHNEHQLTWFQKTFNQNTRIRVPQNEKRLLSKKYLKFVLSNHNKIGASWWESQLLLKNPLKQNKPSFEGFRAVQKNKGNIICMRVQQKQVTMERKNDFFPGDRRISVNYWWFWHILKKGT